LATATSKAAYDWIECLEKYGTGFEVAVGGPFESKVLAQLELLLGAPLKARNFTLQLLLEALVKAR